MTWPKKYFSTWDHFLSIGENLKQRTSDKSYYIFHGQADEDWHLVPSLVRELKQIDTGITAMEAFEVERAMLGEFVSRSGLHFSQKVLSSRTNPAAWLSLMQHHGAPTRLLDWTDSLLVAAYFAVKSHFDKNGAIWIVRAKYLQDETQRIFQGRTISYEMLQPGVAQPVVQLWYEVKPHERVVAQKALFTFCHEIFGDQERTIEKICQPEQQRCERDEVVFCKAIIPRDLKRVFLTALESQNVTSSSLFPGSDELGRSLLELAQMMAQRNKLQRAHTATSSTNGTGNIMSNSPAGDAPSRFG